MGPAVCTRGNRDGGCCLSCSCSMEQLGQYCIPSTPRLQHTQQWAALKRPKEASGFWRAQVSWTEPCVQVGKSLPITSSLLLLLRRQQPIPKLNPPPPILRKRSSKTSPSLEVDIKPESTAHVSLPSPSVSGLTSITATSLTLLDPEARTPARSAAASAEPLPVGTFQRVLSKDRSGENGHTSPPSSIHDPAASDALSKDLAALLSPTDSTLPFSPADDTCLHISFSEDELLEPELDTTEGPSRVPS